MGIGISSAQILLELKSAGHFSNISSICDMGATEIHVNKKDLKDLFLKTDEKTINSIENIPNVNNWPNKTPRSSAKNLYEILTDLKLYKSIDLNGLYDSIKHDLNHSFTDEQYLNKFDLVTDFGSCEHVFNIAEAYKTMHKLTKINGLMIVSQNLYNGNGYFNFDEGFVRGIAASNNYDIIKKINYNYYRNGIDLMVSDKEKGISNIKTTIELFSKIDRYRPNSILKEIFFQSKNNEIYNIFNNDLDIINIEEIKLILNKIAPFYSSKWSKL